MAPEEIKVIDVMLTEVVEWEECYVGEPVCGDAGVAEGFYSVRSDGSFRVLFRNPGLEFVTVDSGQIVGEASGVSDLVFDDEESLSSAGTDIY